MYTCQRVNRDNLATCRPLAIGPSIPDATIQSRKHRRHSQRIGRQVAEGVLVEGADGTVR